MRLKKSLPSLVALGVGMMCAVALLRLWTRNRADLRRNQAVRTAPAGEINGAPAAAGVDALTQSLLTTLQGLLTRSDARPREAVLSFKDEAAYRRFLDRAAKSGLSVVGQIDRFLSVRVRYDTFASLREDLLQHTGDFEGLSANYLMAIPGPPTKEDRAAFNAVPFRNQALEFLGVDPRSPAYARWGQGVTIAVLDTGVAPDATFGTSRLRAIDIGLGTTAGTGGEDGHGTAVASLAVGATPDAPGVAPAANLLSIRVTDANGASDLFTVAQAILAATDAGAKVINISLGGYATSTTLDAAITYATAHGAVIVAAAGNDQASQLTWPAADPRVVSVGAIDANEQQLNFSNSGAQLQITAPGYGVQTAWLEGQRAYVDGTSISAPLVAGAIAAVLSESPALTPGQAWEAIRQTTSDAGAPGADPDFGHGVLNLGWAMNRNDLTRVDTAISSHYYDAATRELNVVVQNRSAVAVTGLNLLIDVAGKNTTQPIPPLAPGASHIVAVPADADTLPTGASQPISSELKNPPGIVDAVPANNRKTSVLAPTGK